MNWCTLLPFQMWYPDCTTHQLTDEQMQRSNLKTNRSLRTDNGISWLFCFSDKYMPWYYTQTNPIYQLITRVIIHQRTSYGNTLPVEIQLDKGCTWLRELETLIPLEQYWANHDSYSSDRNCEEEPLVLWTMSRTCWSYWWRRSYFPLWNCSGTKMKRLISLRVL